MFFKSLEEIREFLPVSTGIEFTRLKPHLQLVEQNFIRPLLGPALSIQLDQAASGQLPEGELQSILSQLLSLVRSAEVHLVYWQGYDVLNAYISDGGFRRIETDKIKGLYKYQEDNLKESFKVNGYQGLDVCLEFIEEKIDVLTSFKESETWKQISSLFIPDTKTFNSIYFIGNSRLVFLRLQPFFQVIEDLQLKPLLGDQILDIIKSEMSKETPEERVVKILPFIRKALAFLSVGMLMEESGADLTDKGLYFEGKTSTFSNDATKQPSESDRITILIKRSKSLGESYLIQLKEHLKANQAAWDNYQAPKTGLHNRDNTAKKTFWA